MTTDLKERLMAGTKERRDDELRQTIKTLPATEDRFRSRTRSVSVDLGRTPTHDEVLTGLLELAEMHPAELVEILRSRRS